MSETRSPLSAVLAGSLAIALAVPPAAAFAAEDAQVPESTEASQTFGAERLGEGDVVVSADTFPDPAFRAWVLDRANLGGIGADGVLSAEERESVVYFRAARQGIYDLTGIELFPNLKMFDVEYNYISKIDLSGNPDLESVYIRNNQLESVDFSNNRKLKFIEVFDNRLTEIDVSMLDDLTFLHADYNRLTEIDLSRNLKLEGDGFVGNNNPLEKIVLPDIAGRSFDTFVISELNDLPGYSDTLAEWYSTPDFQEGTGFIPSTVQGKHFVPFAGQTLYAKRTPNTYSIAFDPNGGTGSMPVVERVWDDGEQNLPKTTFTRLGYRFLGWSPYDNATLPAYVDGQAVENVGGSKRSGETKTLYAVWERIETSAGYFRSQLSSDQQAVYDDIVSQLGNLGDAYDPGVVSVYVPRGVENRLETVLFAALRDHPEYFWIDFAKLAWEEASPNRFSLCLRASDEPCFVEGFTTENLASYREDFESAVNSVVAGAPDDPVLAARYFNDWLAANNVYNPAGLGAPAFSRCAASGLLSANDPASGPVCYGYASAMKVLLDRAGIPNAYVEGFAYNGKNGAGGEQHAWNYVLVDGAWYAIDPTWSDPGVSTGLALDTYFLVGSDTVTSPQLPEAQTFSATHDPSRSPALTYGLGYPSLSKAEYGKSETPSLDEVRESYLSSVDAVRERFEKDASRYAAYDRALADERFESARSAILAALDEGGMREAVLAFEEAISALPDIQERAERLEQAWLSAHAEILSFVDAVGTSNAESVFELTGKALVAADPGELAKRLPADMGADDKRSISAVASGLISARSSNIEHLQILQEAARWVVSAAGALNTPSKDVRSGDVDRFTSLRATFDDLSDSARAVVDQRERGLLASLLSLAEGKRDALASLAEARASLDDEAYDASGKQQLDEVVAVHSQSIEESPDVHAVETALAAGVAALKAVQTAPAPDPDPDPAPNPGPGPLPNPAPDPAPEPSPEPDPDPAPNPDPEPDPGLGAPSFSDVDGHWAYESIEAMSAAGIMTGYSDGRYGPDDVMTRAMFVTTLYRAAGSPETSASQRFADVGSGQWYSDAVAWAADNGITTGYDNGLFGVDDKVSREQAATMLMRYAALSQKDTSKRADLGDYPDADEISPWSDEAMRWANAEGIIKGRENTHLAPKGESTRAEAATVLQRYLSTVG